jgi:hypothetical protein
VTERVLEDDFSARQGSKSAAGKGPGSYSIAQNAVNGSKLAIWAGSGRARNIGFGLHRCFAS